MELLIFCRQYFNGDSAKQGHWLDTEYPAQIAKIEADPKLDYDQTVKAKAVLENKYKGRPQPGDICEVHEDGWWDSKCFGPKSLMPMSFACVKIPGVKPVKYLADPALDGDGRYIHGHRNTIDSSYILGEAVTETEQTVVIRDKVQVVIDGRA